MSSFFDVPSSVPEPERPPRRQYRRPDWHGAPAGAVPGVVPIERVIAATDEVAVAVSAVEVFAEGLAFELVAMATVDPRGDASGRIDPMLFHLHRLPEAGEVPDAMLRVGVEFGDGRKATNMEPSGYGPPDDGAIVLRPGGGGGSEERYEQSFWVWPLPADGVLRIVCEWPAFGIPVTTLDIDGEAILDAAGRSQVVFSDDHLPYPPAPEADDPGWTAYT
ncbi:MAG: hypothetical protein F2817_19155 [Actinobacteria bacterium]|nr:hypothetical protein [Actinomycetota bacterium]